MTTIKLRGINKVKKKLASGKVAIFYYHRATGTRLPGLPGSAEFLEAFKQADGIAPRDVGTVAELIRAYLKGPQFVEEGTPTRSRSRKRGLKPLKQSTQREYKRMLAAIEAAEITNDEGEIMKGKTFGNMPIAALAAPRVIGKFLAYQEQVGMESPREADNRLMVMSAVLSYAHRKGRIARNPLLGYQRMYDGDRSDIIWLEDDIKKFMEGAPIELQRALILALHTGQRYGDLLRLRWADYDGEYIRLKQAKTAAKVTVKVSAALKRMLEATAKVGPYILTRADGRPWFTAKNDKELGKEWRAQAEKAGLYRDDYLSESRNEPDFQGERLHFNDLRGTAITLLAEAGCTVPEIVSITGHTLQSATRILERYLARTKTISDAAILKLENAAATGFANRLQTTVATKS